MSISFAQMSKFLSTPPRVVVALEVDGIQHRFKRKDGAPSDKQRKMDALKNKVTQEVCGGEWCWLGAIRAGSLLADCDGGDDGGMDDPWPGWARFPSRMDPGASFAFLRIPSDGSTFWETDLLRKKALDKGALAVISNSYAPPTIEEYVRKQLENNHTSNNKRYVVVDSAVEGASMNGCAEEGKAGEPENSKREPGALNITQCLKEWRKDPQIAAKLSDVSPAHMNACLLKAGFHVLENGDYGQRKPSERGLEVGIDCSVRESEDGRYTIPVYTQEARNYIAQHLDEILGF